MRRQTKLIIQGYPGSFHDEAARKYFGDKRIELVPAKSFEILARQLKTDLSINYGIMAIENSIAGSILQNYRILREHEFWISGEVFMRISHNLLALPGTELSQIEEVHSHPMALSQCLKFFERYPGIQLVETPDTALAAKHISENQLANIAAVGSQIAANLYNLDMLAQGIETSQVNYTRFIIVSRECQYSSIGNADKASVYLKVSHKKGSLLKVLQCIADHDINISKLQSFPVLGSFNQYYFHLDLEFDTLMQYESCIDEVRTVSSDLDELGIYKRANIYDHQSVK